MEKALYIEKRVSGGIHIRISFDNLWMHFMQDRLVKEV